MQKHVFLAVFMTVGFGVAAGPATQAAERNADEEVLRTAGLSGDGPTLLDFFRKRTVPSLDVEKIKSLIKLLDNDSFSRREQAAAELVRYRRFAEPSLVEAAKRSESLEIVRRAQQCLERIRSSDEAPLERAVARKIAATKPAGAAEVLLAYVPFVVHPTVLDEVHAALAAVTMNEGRANPAIVAALADKVARKRAAAAIVLFRTGGADDRTKARRLLHDAEDEVRFQVGMVLVVAKEKEAVPVLIELLLTLPEELAMDVEDMLIRLADDNRPAQPFGPDNSTRKSARAFWASWWAKEGPRIDMADKKLDVSAIQRTIGTWVNADGNTRGITRARIVSDGRELWIETWGACTGPKGPVESVLGKVALDRQGKGEWNHGFKLTHSKVFIEHGDLVMDEFNEFKDGTNRDYRSRYVFKRVKVPAEFKDPRRQ